MDDLMSTIGVDTRDDERLIKVYETFRRRGPSEKWHVVGTPGEPSFEAGWYNVDAVNYNPAGFFMDNRGNLWLRGLVNTTQQTVFGSFRSASSPIFTLPPDYRPLFQQDMETSVLGYWGGRFTIYIDGRVEFVAPADWNGTEHFSLDGLKVPRP